MTQQPVTTASLANRRRARRCPVRAHVHVECRKGCLGLGPNLAVVALDISETGARLVVQDTLMAWEEVEVLLSGSGVPRPLKRMGKVAWCLALADGRHAIGVSFDKPL